jgi:tRNA threonylcarbamoyladenosine biosynthesis protein TsaB
VILFIMGLILCLETATTVCSVALSKDGKLLAVREVNQGYTHSENLTIFSGQVLAEAGHRFEELDAIAVSKGPGSYTGLRIGVSAAKGFCFALDKPLIAVNTLRAMAYGVGQSMDLKGETSDSGILLCPMIDARRMEVYCAFYDLGNNEMRPTKAEIITGDSFPDILKDNKVAFFGDGAAKCKEALAHPNAIFIENAFPSAEFLVPLAEEKFTKGEFEDVAYFEPYYLKDFVAGGKK